jgi:hypothetical protein
MVPASLSIPGHAVKVQVLDKQPRALVLQMSSLEQKMGKNNGNKF